MVINKLKEIRMREYLLSSRKFAEKLGVAEQQYQRYESGKVIPTLEIALKISIILNKSVNDIWLLK